MCLAVVGGQGEDACNQEGDARKHIDLIGMPTDIGKEVDCHSAESRFAGQGAINDSSSRGTC